MAANAITNVRFRERGASSAAVLTGLALLASRAVRGNPPALAGVGFAFPRRLSDARTQTRQAKLLAGDRTPRTLRDDRRRGSGGGDANVQGAGGERHQERHSSMEVRSPT